MKLGTLGGREKLMLGILVLLAPFVVWKYLKPALLDLANRGSSGIGRLAGVQPRAAARKEIKGLQLAALEKQGGEYEPDRNIFRYGEKPKPPPPPPPPPPPVVERKPRVTAPPQPVVPRPPPLDVALIGIFGPERKRVAVLTDDQGMLINALEQQVIREKFIVHEIGYESVEFKFIGFPDTAAERIEIGG